MTSSMLIQQSWTWHQLFFFNLDRPVNDLAWKVSHGVHYMVDRLASFDYDFSTTCFCSDPMKSLQHLFFHFPLAISVLSWLIPCVELFCFTVFCSVSLCRSCCWCLRFFVICFMSVNFVSGRLIKTFFLGVSVPRLWRSWSM